jgi:DNA repair exonuclease SbcCD ATPase subunit
MKRAVVLSVVAGLCLVLGPSQPHAQQPPGPDAKEEALKKLEQFYHDLDDLEQKLTDERIKVRTAMMEREEAVRLVDRLQRSESQALAAERKKLEDAIRDIERRAVPGGEADKIKDSLRKKLADLAVEQEKNAVQGAQSRQELMAIEERFRLLERKQDNQRRLLNLKIELVESELLGKRDGIDRRKLEKIEKSLESMQRDLEALKKKLDGKSELRD